MPRLSRSIDSYSRSSASCSFSGHRLTDAHGAEPLEVGHAVEEEDALDQLVGVLHLVDRLVAEVLRERLVAPVVEHLVVDEVLVHGRELGGEDLVEQLDDLSVSSHAPRLAVNVDELTGSVEQRVVLEQLLQRRPAPAALGARAAADGQLLDRSGALCDLVLDLVVGHGSAVAHVHDRKVKGT